MNASPRILVVGSYATALVMETERLPLAGETLIGRNFREVHGGKGSNQAVQAARLGSSVSFLARVGADAHGDAMLALMAEEGVDTGGVIRDQKIPTGVGFIVVDAQGRNLITLDMGANQALTPADLEARAGLFSGVAAVIAQQEIPVKTALAALRMGRAAGAVTLLNPAPAADLSGYDLSEVDFLLPNETEARICAGLPADTPIDATAARLRALGCNNVIITLGEAGCLWLDEHGKSLLVPGFSVQAVDSVGAGDAFCAGFAVGLSEGKTIPDALRFAHAVAALSVTRPDTIPSYHTRSEVEEMIARS
jgi:ribokinase